MFNKSKKICFYIVLWNILSWLLSLLCLMVHANSYIMNLIMVYVVLTAITSPIALILLAYILISGVIYKGNYTKKDRVYLCVTTVMFIIVLFIVLYVGYDTIHFLPNLIIITTELMN